MQETKIMCELSPLQKHWYKCLLTRDASLLQLNNTITVTL
jgi:hypothetical protein